MRPVPLRIAQYAPGKVVFYKSQDPNRVFEVQTDMYSFHRPAVHCAIAARENDDVVVISLCRDGHTIDYRRTCGSAACKAGGFPKVGITSGGSPRYTIDFESGAQIRGEIHYWSAIGKRYINVFATAPGVDRARTLGVCGNNNGNPNDDVNVGHNGWIHDLATLFESQRVTTATDVFRFVPTGVAAPVPAAPFAEECAYIDPPFVRPILNQPNVEVRYFCWLRPFPPLLLPRRPPPSSFSWTAGLHGGACMWAVGHLRPPQGCAHPGRGRCGRCPL
jgi:hypothetical protein